jgi:hypothetical protein
MEFARSFNVLTRMNKNQAKSGWLPDVGIGSKADVTLLNFDVCFTPESGHYRSDLLNRCRVIIRSASANLE